MAVLPLLVGALTPLVVVCYVVRKEVGLVTCGVGRYLYVSFARLFVFAWPLFFSASLVGADFLYEYSPGPQWGLRFALLVGTATALWAVHARIAVLLLGAHEGVPATLTGRIAAVAAAEGLPAPRVLVFPDRGTALAVPMAVPGLLGIPVVFLTDSLLAPGVEDEAYAIALHELSHLRPDEKRRRTWRQWSAWCLPLIGIPVCSTIWPDVDVLAGLALVLIGFWICRASVFRHYETRADLFAARVAGPETAIAALTRIHASFGLPRRFDANREAKLSHPSLARRIAAIRKEFGMESPAEEADEATPVAVTDPAGRPFRICASAELLHIEPVDAGEADPDAQATAIPLERIIATELQEGRKGRRLLVRWADVPNDLRFGLADPEMERARALMASVDDQFLSPGSPCVRSVADAAKSAVSTSVAFGVLLAPFGGLAMALPALANLRRRHSEVLLGQAVGAFAGMSVALAWGVLIRSWLATCLLPLGFVCFACCWGVAFLKHRAVQAPSLRTQLFHYLLAPAATAWLYTILLGGSGLLLGFRDWHFAAITALFAFLPGAGAALSLSRPRRPRLAVMSVVLASVNSALMLAPLVAAWFAVR